MTCYCSGCDSECEIKIVDDSFSHEFGAREILSVESICCEATVYRDEAMTETITVDEAIRKMKLWD